jgi:hypothetical protein
MEANGSEWKRAEAVGEKSSQVRRNEWRDCCAGCIIMIIIIAISYVRVF